MKLMLDRAWLGLLCGLLVLPAGGCGIITDVFDVGLAAQFGLDPASIRPSQGTVIVAFRNATNVPVTFLAWRSADTVDLTRDSRNFSVEVQAGEVGNEVLDCPVGIISPGSLSATYAPDTVGATITTTGAAVAYGGTMLVSGQAFSCGDVIEIRVSPGTSTGEDAAAQYVITVRVIPGQ